MSRFESIVNSRKERVPQLPRIYSLMGYDPFRFPHVFNYFIFEGYVVYVRKNRRSYSVITDGWIYSDSLETCSFERDGYYVAYSDLPHVSALERFSDVCSMLQKCFVFDIIKRPRYEYILERAESIAYENFSPSTAEKIISDKFGCKELFSELS